MEQPISVWTYGFVGVAAVGAISLALLGIIVAGAPADQLIILSSY